MGIFRILGIAIFVLGIVLLIWGINATGSVSEKVMEGTVGRYTHQTTLYIIGGVVLIIGGLALFFRRR